jgi:uncharacterized membrane protein (UPF0127 family)
MNRFTGPACITSLAPMFRLAAFHLATLAFVLELAAANPARAAGTAPLTIDTGQGSRAFTVELATTPDEMQVGLMFRQSLEPDAGMLFVYPSDQQVAFWMKNTVIPLDMLFIASDGHIRRIVERTVPLSTIPIPSVDQVRAVLEVNGGTAARLGIKTGDVVHAQAFGNSP